MLILEEVGDYYVFANPEQQHHLDTIMEMVATNRSIGNLVTTDGMIDGPGGDLCAFVYGYVGDQAWAFVFDHTNADAEYSSDVDDYINMLIEGEYSQAVARTMASHIVKLLNGRLPFEINIDRWFEVEGNTQ